MDVWFESAVRRLTESRGPVLAYLGTVLAGLVVVLAGGYGWGQRPAWPLRDPAWLTAAVADAEAGTPDDWQFVYPH